MKRRELLAGLLAAAASGAVQAAEPEKVYRIALVTASASVEEMTETGANPAYAALFRELRRLGYLEGQNLFVQRFSGGGDTARYDSIVKDAIGSKPDLIIAITNPMVLRLKGASESIPVVGTMSDPLSYGIVSSLARPSGNITGVTGDAGIEIWGKRLGMLREVVPKATRIGFVASKYVWDHAPGLAIREAAKENSVILVGSPLEGVLQEAEYRRVFDSLKLEQAQALVVAENPENLQQRRPIVEFAEAARLPTIYPYRAFVDSGGLMTYGADIPDIFRRLAAYADQILKGTKPGLLPIYQATKFDLIINLKTAKSLGIELPATLLARADEVIE